MDNPLYKIKLLEPKDFNISFRFADGEEVVFKEAKSLQDFIDKMNNYHELKKENMRLKELLKECRDYLYEDSPLSMASMIEEIDEVLNEQP